MQASLGLKRLGGPLGSLDPEVNGPAGASASAPSGGSGTGLSVGTARNTGASELVVAWPGGRHCGEQVWAGPADGRGVGVTQKGDEGKYCQKP